MLESLTNQQKYTTSNTTLLRRSGDTSPSPPVTWNSTLLAAAETANTSFAKTNGPWVASLVGIGAVTVLLLFFFGWWKQRRRREEEEREKRKWRDTERDKEEGEGYEMEDGVKVDDGDGDEDRMVDVPLHY